MRNVSRLFVFASLIGGLLGSGIASLAQARVWTDKSGLYTIDADLFAFNDEHVIVKRTDGQMGMYEVESLSDADREFLKSEEASKLSSTNLNKEQAWTMRHGYRLVGKIVDYAKLEVTFQRRRAKSWVNDRQFKSLPEMYQTIVLKTAEELSGTEDMDEQKFDQWLLKSNGSPMKYDIEGVVIELADGNEYTVPFSLFSEESLAILKSGWDEWLSAHEQSEPDHETKNDESFRLQSSAAAMQQERALDRQIAVANLSMNAVNAGIFDYWEVTLYPPSGGMGSPGWVVVPGRNSEQAKYNALRQYPGYVPGPIRKVSRGRR